MQSIDSFGRNFRAIREDSKLKQYQIAERLGMTSPAISMWENKGTIDCGSIPCPEEYCKEGNFFIKITGDSMNNVLTDGSYALIDTHVDAQSGDVALVKVNGDDATVKRIKKMDGFIVLEPDSTNPSHKRRIIDATDQSSPEVRILGKVVYAVNRL